MKQLITPILFKSVFPAALTALGTVMAVLWSEGFRAFCGL